MAMYDKLISELETKSYYLISKTSPTKSSLNRVIEKDCSVKGRFLPAGSTSLPSGVGVRIMEVNSLDL